MSGTSYRNIVNILFSITISIISMTFSYFNIQGTFKQIIFCTSVILISVITCIYLDRTNNFIKCTTKKDKKILSILEKQGYKKDEKHNIYYKEETEIHNIVNLVENLNKKHLSDFEEKGFVIIVGNPLNKKGINGVFDHIQKYIMICVEGRNEDDIISTFYHEWGHFLDYYWNYISDMPAFKSQFVKYKRACKKHVRDFYKLNKIKCEKKIPLLNAYEFTSPSEYFAVNYSRHKRNELSSQFFKTIFDEIDK